MKRPFLRILLASIVLLSASACRKTKVGDDVATAKEAHRLMRFHQELLPLLLRVRSASNGPEPAGDTSFCGELVLVKGDSSIYPDGNDLVYRYRPGDTCSPNFYGDPSGALRIAFRGKMEEEGSIVEVEGKGFHVDGIRFNESFTVRRRKGHWLYEWKGTVLRSKGKEVRMVGEMKADRSRGGNTEATVMDDRYRFAPAIKGEGIGDGSYAIETRERVEREMSCPWPEKGRLWVKPRDLGAREMIYGVDEGCSNEARVDVNGRSFQFTLE